MWKLAGFRVQGLGFRVSGFKASGLRGPRNEPTFLGFHIMLFDLKVLKKGKFFEVKVQFTVEGLDLRVSDSRRGGCSFAFVV